MDMMMYSDVVRMAAARLCDSAVLPDSRWCASEYVYSCNAILLVGEEFLTARENAALIDRYAELFCPEHVLYEGSHSLGSAWGHYWVGPDEIDFDERWNVRQECRTLALCFFAAMLEEEGV
jgi:hypothetical protein